MISQPDDSTTAGRAEVPAAGIVRAHAGRPSFVSPTRSTSPSSTGSIEFLSPTEGGMSRRARSRKSVPNGGREANLTGRHPDGHEPRAGGGTPPEGGTPSSD